MKRNLELKEIREKKREIYKGLRILLSKGRKTGCELGNLNLSDISDKDMYYVKQLQKFLGSSLDFSADDTYENLIKVLMKEGYSDDVCQFTYKVDRLDNDTIYVLIFKDKYKNKYDRVDIFIINNSGEKR